MTCALCFRLAEPADVPHVVALVESAYRGPGSRRGWTTEADLLDGQRTDEEAVRALMTSQAKPTRFVLGYEADVLVGCVALTFEQRRTWLGMLAVRPDRQALGAGKALLAEAERVAHAHAPARALCMSVIAQRDELIAYYVRRGYQQTNETLPFPYGEPRFGVPRRPDLYFVVLRKR